MPHDVVHVWWIPLDPPEPAEQRLAALLADAERTRYAALGTGLLRRRYAVAHGAMRLIVGAYLDVPPGELRWRTGRWGKPELTCGGPQVSLSHCADLALVAVAARRPVGVDIERLPPAERAARLTARYFPGSSVSPALFAAAWTRREALVKAAGVKLADGLTADVSRAGPLTDPAERIGGEWRTADLAAPPGFAAAVAQAGRDPFTTVSYPW